MPRNSSISQAIDAGLDSAKRAKKSAAAIERTWLHRLEPYFTKRKATPDIRYFVELVGRQLAALSAEVTAGVHRREMQRKAHALQKERELKAAQQVRAALELVRFYVAMTLGKASVQQYFGGSSCLSKQRGGALLGAGESLVQLLGDETVDWERFAENESFMPRARVATDLERALAAFRQEVAASEASRAKNRLAAEAWGKERAEKLENIGAARRLLSALLREGCGGLEGVLDFPSKSRGRKSESEEAPAGEKARADRAPSASEAGSFAV